MHAPRHQEAREVPAHTQAAAVTAGNQGYLRPNILAVAPDSTATASE